VDNKHDKSIKAAILNSVKTNSRNTPASIKRKSTCDLANKQK